MKTELINQFAHTWRIFEALVEDFDPETWIHTGRGPTTPARLSLHVLQGTKYYIEDAFTIVFASGKPFDIDAAAANEDELPSQDDLVAYIHEMVGKTEVWLSEMEYDAENRLFPWAGETRLSVVLFLLRHSVYHLGELTSLLNESRNGDAKDNWIKTL